MPSLEHEVLVELFQQQPLLAVDVLSVQLGLSLPPFEEARVIPGNLTSKRATALQADVVVLLEAGLPVQAVIVEVQLQPVEDKRKAWPNYITLLNRERNCPAMLLVVCPDGGTAEWAAQPIPLGHPGFVLTPLVLGPKEVPVVKDPGQARSTPELAVLSALAHGNDHPERDMIFRAFLEGLNNFEQERADAYTQMLQVALSAAAKRQLEELMTYAGFEIKTSVFRDAYAKGKTEGRAAGEAAGRARGEAAGLAGAVLAVLAERGIEVTDADRARITGCSDLELLGTWVRRAARVDSVKALLA